MNNSITTEILICSRTSVDAYAQTVSAAQSVAPTSVKSSDAPPINISAIIGSLSSVAAVAFCILMAWILVRRKRVLEQREKAKVEGEGPTNDAYPQALAYMSAEANSTTIHEAPNASPALELNDDNNTILNPRHTFHPIGFTELPA